MLAHAMKSGTRPPPRTPYAHLRFLKRPPRPPMPRNPNGMLTQAEIRDFLRAKIDATRARRPIPVDVVQVRLRLGLTQTQFARRFGFSVKTLRHWEQGEREPRGPAKVLLSVIEHNPRAVLEALAPALDGSAKPHEEFVTNP